MVQERSVAGPFLPVMWPARIGCPPPLALLRSQTSLVGFPLESPPPKTIIVPVDGSYAEESRYFAGAGLPTGFNCVQAGVPPKPFALLSTHVSLRGPVMPLDPPKIVI